MAKKQIKDIKTNELFDNIFDNALEDRDNARKLFDELYGTLNGDAAHHATNGIVIAKYLEVMCKANDQLLKLANIRQHGEIEQKKNETKTMTQDEIDKIFSEINKND